MNTSLIACVTTPHILVHVARRQVAGAAVRPCAVASGASERATLIDVCSRAVARGVHMGMSPYEARQRCISLCIVPTHELNLAPTTTTIEERLLHHSDVVQQDALGAWTLQLVALGKHYRHAQAVLWQVQQETTRAIQLPCGIGAGPNRLIATLAAQHHRPRAKPVIVLPGQEARFLAPLPVRALPGVGAQSAAALARLGITNIGQLAALAERDVIDVLGPRGRHVWQRAHGHDVMPKRYVEETITDSWIFANEPCADPHGLHVETRILTERVGRALRAQDTAAGQLTLLLRWNDGRQTEHTVRFVPRRDLDSELAAASHSALERLLAERRLAVQSITICVTDVGAIQRDLFTANDERPRRLQQAVDAIKQKQGTGAIRVGWLLSARRRKQRAA